MSLKDCLNAEKLFSIVLAKFYQICSVKERSVTIGELFNDKVLKAGPSKITFLCSTLFFGVYTFAIDDIVEHHSSHYRPPYTDCTYRNK